MEVFALSGLINGIIALTISILVFTRNKESIANKTFSLFALAVAIWSFGFWRWLLAPNSQAAIFWIKLFTLPSILIPALYFHWIISLLKVNRQ